MPNDSAQTNNSATTFLLAEHGRLCELYLSTRETAERRVTLYLTLTTTIVGVSVALWQLGLPQIQILEMTLAAALGIFLLGFITFHRLLERSMQGTEYLRAINRIHHYFVEHAPEIEPYFFWAPTDDNPRYDARGVGGAETREVIQLADCLFLAIAAGVAVVLFDINQQLLAVIVGGIAFVVAFFAHRGYEVFVLAREEKRKSSRVQFASRSENPQK